MLHPKGVLKVSYMLLIPPILSILSFFLIAHIRHTEDNTAFPKFDFLLLLHRIGHFPAPPGVRNFIKAVFRGRRPSKNDTKQGSPFPKSGRGNPIYRQNGVRCTPFCPHPAPGKSKYAIALSLTNWRSHPFNKGFEIA